MGRPPKTLDPTTSQAARLGAAIRHQREVRGMTQEALAGAINFSRGHLALVELGKAQASEELVRLCDDALHADGRLLTIFPEVVAERERERLQRNRPRSPWRPGNVPPASHRSRQAMADDSGGDETEVGDPHIVSAFFGTSSSLTITLPLRTLRTGRRLIAQEDFEAAEALARSAQGAGISTRFQYVEPDGDFDLTPPALVVFCGPKCSSVVTHLIASDPFFSFGPDGDGQWRLTEKASGTDLRSPLDSPFPANQDLAYVARLARPGSDRPLLLVAGVHAVGSMGAATFLSDPSKLAQLHASVADEKFSMVVACTFTRWPLRILASEALIGPRTHP